MSTLTSYQRKLHTSQTFLDSSGEEKNTADDIPVSLKRNCENSSKDIRVNPGNGGAVTTQQATTTCIRLNLSADREVYGKFKILQEWTPEGSPQLFSQYTTVCKKIARCFYQNFQFGDEEVFRFTKSSGLIFTKGITHSEKYLAKLDRVP